MALVGLILVFTFIGRIIGVDGSSMMPTLHDHDMLLLQSIGYTPESGDVVVLSKKSFRGGPAHRQAGHRRGGADRGHRLREQHRLCGRGGPG